MAASDHLGEQFTLYHGAHHDDIDSIRQHGLRPSASGPTVTDSREGASMYAGLRDWTEPKVVELSIPGHYLSKGHEGVTGEGNTYALRATVPPEHIRAIHDVYPS